MSGSQTVAVTLTAVDKSASIIDKFGARIRAMGAPADRLGKSISKIGDVAGVNKLSQGMQSLSSRSLDVFRSLDRIAPSLAGITGAASITGMTALVQRWGELGQRVANASQRLGIPTDRLTALQGAARLAGSSAEDLTAGLGALDERLRGATFSRDPLAIQSFNKLGVAFKGADGSARKAGDAFADVADGIKKIYDSGPAGRGQALRIAQSLGIDNLLPLLLKGRSGIQQLSAEAAKLGVVISPEAATRATALRTSFTEVSEAAEGLGNSIADKLSGPVERFNGLLVKWIENNRDLISTDVAGWVTSFGNALNGLDKAKMGALLGAAIGYKIGGWRGALLGAGAGYTWANEGQPNDIGVDPATGQLAPDVIENHAKPFSWWNPGTWWNHSNDDSVVPAQHPHPAAAGTPAFEEMQREHAFWLGKGLTEDQVAGPLASVAAESGFDPSKWNKDHTSYGLYQMTGTRLRAMQARYHTDEPTADQQREYAYDELQGSERSSWLALTASKTRPEAGRAFTGFERPAGQDQRAQERSDAASQFAGVFPDPPQAPNGHVKVDVTLSGAPSGTTVKTATTGQVSAPPPKVVLPMSGIAGDYSRGF